jgi:uracil-DNA glycosylase family protein
LAKIKDHDPKLDSITSLNQLENLAESCRNCELYKNGNLVFGEGKKSFSIVVIGEQPGNDEEIKKHPFVGPSGKFLKKILSELKIDIEKIYFTNAVKHFRFEQIGKRRIHKKPKVSQMRACRIWLDRELKLIKPKLIVCLGGTAAHSIFLSAVSVNKNRGKLLESHYGPVLITFHPSFFLRQTDPEAKKEYLKLFKKDLKTILKYL